MKAYQIRIELTGSDPLIWRRVVMPADATFNRLHDVIQTVTNFQGGYPHTYHLFEFDLPDDAIIVTNDEEAYQEHQHFKKNREAIKAKMRDVPPEFASIQEARLQELEKTVRKPAGIKIDTYLEKYGQLSYIYDYGDYWQFLVTLKAVKDDYHYGYPTLIDGAGTAPPEDVGGLPGYDEFLRIYHDENHPDHEHMKAWAKEQMFREYDPEFINEELKSIMYKKTEWDQIT
ncbi:plasmid pRiA4b ORF-3 family protein [Lentibacillus kapialis]|uniref:Plasmid pRiA4b ORF-3 family protein n=1 Tax=Lentibacillus kapialis TaxID=340214 RepID=A0A917UXH1_9BACI|nr:plasmid pRiA4b ORF-3 family protein [Lentibacillus kapialis]GGJ94713.1 plasmid pRiA4b ORF-3 family protein [Lentibacillus kapialis]